MRVGMTQVNLGAVALALCWLLGCAPTRPAISGSDESGLVSVDGPLPVEADDIQYGVAGSPVTIVAFLDFECPYCAQVHPTLEQLLEEYPSQLRLVVKHSPLPFHRRGVPAARAMQAVYELRGAEAALEYMRLLFDSPSKLSDGNLSEWAEQVGVDGTAFARLMEDPRTLRVVAHDRELARSLGVNGVPAFFVNGAPLTGVQPLASFRALVEHELRAAAELARTGTAAADIHAARVQVNLRPPDQIDPNNDRMRFRVELGDSPSVGPKDAPVTIVEFADFECPYCLRAHVVIEQLMSRYPGKIRWVMKHNPLGFHPHAVKAAIIALEIRSQRGSHAYWQALGQLFSEARLNDQVLRQLVQQYTLDETQLRASLALGEDHPQLVGDQDQALDLLAEGTPHFFINGRRLPGAQPLERFEQLVQQELTVATALRERGVAPGGIYRAIMAQAFAPPGLVKVSLPPAGPDLPAIGLPEAAVVVQMFSDFECGYCRRVMPTVIELKQRYGDQLRIVWRHLPLGFHPHARRAAYATAEAHAQQGSVGFWRLAALIFAEERVLTDATLVELAERAGLDAARVESALRDKRHEATIRRDELLAASAQVRGTPGFIINGYQLFGAQPLRRFERLVRVALKEHALKEQQAGAAAGVQ